MTLDQIAIIAEIVAAFGVILTMLFLAYELHLTRKQADLSNWRDLLQALADYKSVTNDLGFAEFLTRANQDYAALTPAEQFAYGMYLEQGVHVWGNFLKHNDTIPRKLVGLEDAVFNSLRDMLDNPGARAWYAETRPRGRFMPQTYVMLDHALTK